MRCGWIFMNFWPGIKYCLNVIWCFLMQQVFWKNKHLTLFCLFYCPSSLIADVCIQKIITTSSYAKMAVLMFCTSFVCVVYITLVHIHHFMTQLYSQRNLDTIQLLCQKFGFIFHTLTETYSSPILVTTDLLKMFSTLEHSAMYNSDTPNMQNIVRVLKEKTTQNVHRKTTK